MANKAHLALQAPSAMSRQPLRAKIIALSEHHPQWTRCRIARAAGCSHKTVTKWLTRSEVTASLADKGRSGRKRLLPPEILAELLSLATQSNPYSCRKLAQHVQAQYGVKVSSETIRRYLGQAGMKHGLPRYVPALTSEHRRARVDFAEQHVKRTSFSSWMFTDSKIFLLSRAQSKQGVKVWYARGARPVVQVKHGTLGLHVYIGVTKYGITKPCFVTGAGSQKSSYANVKTGAMYRGVLCSRVPRASVATSSQGG